MRYEAPLQPSRRTVKREACKTRDHGRAKGGEGVRSAKIQSKVALRNKHRSAYAAVPQQGRQSLPQARADGEEGGHGGSGAAVTGDTGITHLQPPAAPSRPGSAGSPHAGTRRPPSQ